LNHRKKTKADGSRLIPRKYTETLVLLNVPEAYVISTWSEDTPPQRAVRTWCHYECVIPMLVSFSLVEIGAADHCI